MKFKYILKSSIILIACALPYLSQAKENIALVISTLNNPFFVSLKEGAENKAKELGYNLVVLDSQNNPAKELSNVQDLIVKKTDLIMINPTDSDSVSNSIIAANNANIPVITLDRSSAKGDVASHIASDNVAGGKIAADYIINKLGPNPKIIQLEGITGTSASRERGKGFVNELKEKGVKTIASQSADFNRTKAMNVTQNLLTTNPQAQAIFAQNDEMALGAARGALVSGFNNILIIGFDGTDEAISAIKANQLSATIAQQPSLIGETGVKIADQVLKGKPVDKVIPVPLQLITNDKN